MRRSMTAAVVVESRRSCFLRFCRLSFSFPPLSLPTLPFPLPNSNSASPPSSCAFETRRRRR